MPRAFQHLIDATRVHVEFSGYAVLKLSAPSALPNLDSVFKSESAARLPVRYGHLCLSMKGPEKILTASPSGDTVPLLDMTHRKLFLGYCGLREAGACNPRPTRMSRFGTSHMMRRHRLLYVNTWLCLVFVLPRKIRKGSHDPARRLRRKPSIKCI